MIKLPPDYPAMSKADLFQEGIDRYVQLQLAWHREFHLCNHDRSILEYLSKQLKMLEEALPLLVQS